MTATTTAPAPAAVRTRITSIDIVRGIVMVLMAIDHVRVYSGVPAGGPTASVFLTRWVTHFCAPAFVFLAGTSAYLYGRRVPRRELAAYLLTRGALLALLEFTVIRASWTFGVDYSQFILAGVIWMLGICMALMAALVWLPVWAIGVLGLAMIVGQDVFGGLPQTPMARLLYLGGEIQLGAGGPSVSVLYSIVPWIGVMAFGYAFGGIMTREPDERRRLCLGIGLGATALFVALAAVPILTSGTPGDGPAAWMRMLNQRKYPASQLFLLMTLGPAIALMPFVERVRGPVSRMFETFGRVPMFYYLLHIPLIHAVSLVVWNLRDGTSHAEWFATAPYVFVPPGQRWSLALLYLVFTICVALLYPACRWYANVKARRPRSWLRYI